MRSEYALSKSRPRRIRHHSLEPKGLAPSIRGLDATGRVVPVDSVGSRTRNANLKEKCETVGQDPGSDAIEDDGAERRRRWTGSIKIRGGNFISYAPISHALATRFCNRGEKNCSGQTIAATAVRRGVTDMHGIFQVREAEGIRKRTKE